jgi:carbonic anhydrase/acetyltransferase-like protein (isoleucine patch superfamily)
VEGRLLLNAGPAGLVNVSPALRAELLNPPGFQPIRPNTPVLPYGASSSSASFLDTTVQVTNGQHTFIGYQNFVAPYVRLNSASGFIKIGNGSDIQDNSQIISNPNDLSNSPVVFVGNNVVIGYGATILGPSTIGGYDVKVQPVSIGANALIDAATIEPGAIVSPLARVGPGVTVPSGFRVKAGANVTTDAEASDPALGKVVKVTSSDLSNITEDLKDSKALAKGYNILYQGIVAAGTSPGVAATVSGVNNGYLPNVEGSGPEPGSTLVPFEPSNSLAPQYLAPNGRLMSGLYTNLRARVIGQVIFHATLTDMAHHLGRSNSIRADEGQPITFASNPVTGNGVTINSPLGGTVSIGKNLQAQDGSVILGWKNDDIKIGDNVTVGAGAVVDRSSIGSNSTIGPRAYVFNSTLPAGSVVPAGAIILNGHSSGSVQW